MSPSHALMFNGRVEMGIALLEPTSFASRRRRSKRFPGSYLVKRERNSQRHGRPAFRLGPARNHPNYIILRVLDFEMESVEVTSAVI